jgi:hypothetical protein
MKGVHVNLRGDKVIRMRVLVKPIALALAIVATGASCGGQTHPPFPAASDGATSRPRPSVDSTDLTVIAAATPSELSTPKLSIRTIESRVGPDGEQDFVIVFDRSVPDDQISYINDITKAGVAHVAYTTQEWTPEEQTPLMTCGDSHFGFSPPAIVGQVDVLIPGEWFAAPPDVDKIIWTHDPEGSGLKTPLCGPHDGHVQFAIWGPSSHDPHDIRVYFEDRTRLVVEIRPTPVEPSRLIESATRRFLRGVAVTAMRGSIDYA